METQRTNHIDMGNVLKQPVEDLLKASGVDLINGEALHELEVFQN